MARVAEGFKLAKRRGIYTIRFTWKGEPKELSTRSRDPQEAPKLGAQLYADFTSGRLNKDTSRRIAHPGTPLDGLIAEWIVAILPELGDDTDDTYTYYGKHWLRTFQTVGDIDTAGIGDYQRSRLKEVLRGTVELELSALRRFLRWLVDEKKNLPEVPKFPEMGKKAVGTKFKVKRRGKATLYTPEQIDSTLAALPMSSERKSHGRYFPIRSRFIFAYETALRPATINKLVFGDLTEFGLHIRPEADKNRWERTLPISDRARDAIKSLGSGDPDELMFGRHDFSDILKAAAVRALGQSVGGRMTPYDLKHARITAWFEEGHNEPGIQFLTGTRSSLRHYVHASRRAAEDVLFRGRIGDEGKGAITKRLKKGSSGR